jgi:uncharacterized protein YutE (UPF0331/DUF86 family)
MSEPTALSLLEKDVERIESRLSDTERGIGKVAVLESQVEMLREAVDRLTNVVFQAAIAIVATGVLGVLAALILKGVIG